VLFLYGTGEFFYDDFTYAAAGPLRDLLGGAHPAIEVQTFDGLLHGFTTLKAQDAALARTRAWVQRF
jgi:hypothetical protein